MRDTPSLHPDRFVDTATAHTPAVPRSDTIVDQWVTDHFHGDHHARALADPHGYIVHAAQELKRRLAQER